jgi:hypothetical protein
MSRMVLRVALPAVLVFYSAVCAGQASEDRSAHIDLGRGIPLVKVSINGRGPFNFVVDTGTNCPAIVSPKLVKQLGLPTTGHKQITDLGSRETHALDEVSLGSLTVAGTEFHSVQAAVTDLPDGDSIFDGILGFGLFHDHLLTIDYPRKRLSLSEGTLAGNSNPNILPMLMPGGIPVIEIAIAGEQVRAGVDSGGIGLSLPAPLASRLKFASGMETVGFSKTQVSAFELRGGTLEGTIEFAGFRFSRPWVEINPVFPVANIGSAALKDFTVTFDQVSKLVRFASATPAHSLNHPNSEAEQRLANELVGTVVIDKMY